MKKLKIKVIAGVLVLTLVSLGFVTISQPAKADQLDDQIKSLQQQVAQNQKAANEKATEAKTLRNKVAEINSQIYAAQAAINLTNAQIQQTQGQIDEANRDLDRQKAILKDNLRLVYKQGEVSPLELVASSKNLSDFVAQTQYLRAIKNKIGQNLKKIDQLKDELNQKQAQLNTLAGQQQGQLQIVANQRAEQQRLLSQTEGDEAKYQQQVKDGSASIAALQRQKAINLANQLNINRGGSGGYPWAGSDQAWWSCVSRTGNWQACGPEELDGQSYFTRQCTSYVAWKVKQVHGYLPSNYGNAYSWPNSATSRGIPTSYGVGAKAGDAAVNTAGSTGHVMYVEEVYPNGSIRVSQYNAEWTGTYSTATYPSQAGLWFIHF